MPGARDQFSGRFTADRRRRSGQRIDPALQAFPLHRSLRIILNVVRDHGLLFPDRLPDQALSPSLRHGERRIVEEAPYLAVPGDRYYPHGLAVEDAHPGHAELPGPYGDAARIAKKLVPAVRAHDSRVDSAQHCVDTTEPHEFSLLLAPLRDVPGNSIYPDHVACRVAGETSAPLDPPYLAARLHDAAL